MDTQQDRKRNVKQELLEWIRALVIALVVAVFLTQVVVVNAQVPSESMESTINVGDRLIGFRLAYLFNNPQRGDIIIFRFPDDESQLYVKRIIGLPGEKVLVQGGEVFINDALTPLAEEYVKSAPVGNFGPYFVPEGCYFVMGDNRANSWDSRYWTNTFVRREKIVGKAVFRLFPNPSVLH